MFLRKWRFGKIAIGFLVAAFLVLGGINLMGLSQGQQVINQAEAIRIPIILHFDHETLPDGSFRCVGDAWRCLIILAAQSIITLTPDGVSID